MNEKLRKALNNLRDESYPAAHRAETAWKLALYDVLEAIATHVSDIAVEVRENDQIDLPRPDASTDEWRAFVKRWLDATSPPQCSPLGKTDKTWHPEWHEHGGGGI